MPSPFVTPNMSLSEPIIGGTLSPQWAMLLNADLTVIDGHNHTPGSGVPIPSGGLNINADLNFNGNSITNLNALIFQGAVTGPISDLSVYTNGTDLFYKDINGNPIQLTKAGQPNTSAGNIQGLPSTPIGGAGITWVNAQSTFRMLMDSGAAGANVEMGSLILRYPGSYPTPTGNFIEISAPTTLATGYQLLMPGTLPASQSMLSFDNAGVGSFLAPDGSSLDISGGVLEVASGGIDSTKLASDLDLPGTNVQADSKSVVTGSAAFGRNMIVCAGLIGSSGSIIQDYGVSSTAHGSTGSYGVTLTHTYVGNPIVVVTTSSPGNRVASIQALSNNSFSIQIVDMSNSPSNSDFHFIVYGN